MGGMRGEEGGAAATATSPWQPRRLIQVTDRVTAPVPAMTVTLPFWKLLVKVEPDIVYGPSAAPRLLVMFE